MKANDQDQLNAKVIDTYQALLDTIRASMTGTYDPKATVVLQKAFDVSSALVTVNIDAGLKSDTERFAQMLPKIEAAKKPLQALHDEMLSVVDKIADGAKVVSALASAIHLASTLA